MFLYTKEKKHLFLYAKKKKTISPDIVSPVESITILLLSMKRVITHGLTNECKFNCFFNMCLLDKLHALCFLGIKCKKYARKREKIHKNEKK